MAPNVEVSHRGEATQFVSLTARTYLDADGFPTLDAEVADTLLGIVDTEYTVDEAKRIGLLDGNGKVRRNPLADAETPEDAYRRGQARKGGRQRREPPAVPALADMKKAELLALAEEREIKVAAKATKAEIIAALEAAPESEEGDKNED